MTDNTPVVTSLNPYKNKNQVEVQPENNNPLQSVEIQRAVAETQAAYMAAHARPRIPSQAVDKMLIECQRPTLADIAIYSYPKGGKEVTGPSIRLAETIKRNWGNMRSGWQCLGRSAGKSTIRTFAIDYETNVIAERVFEVSHKRDKNIYEKGVKKKIQEILTDERDIYELEANQAARRVRACILELVDGDIIEACVKECQETLKANVDLSPEKLKHTIKVFANHGVNQKMLEARIGRNFEKITAAQALSLKSILNSLKDGMSSIETWFDITLQDQEDESEADKEPKKSKSKKKEDKTEPSLETIKQEHKKEQEQAETEPEKKSDCARCNGKGEIVIEKDGKVIGAESCPECQNNQQEMNLD